MFIKCTSKAAYVKYDIKSYYYVRLSPNIATISKAELVV